MHCWFIQRSRLFYFPSRVHFNSVCWATLALNDIRYAEHRSASATLAVVKHRSGKRIDKRFFLNLFNRVIIEAVLRLVRWTDFQSCLRTFRSVRSSHQLELSRYNWLYSRVFFSFWQIKYTFNSKICFLRVLLLKTNFLRLKSV